jgi:hypothetical protein
VRRPWPALVLLIGGTLLLVALYLPWQRFTQSLADYFGRDRGTVQHLLQLFGDTSSWDGWSSGVAPAAALSALLLVALAGAALVRPVLLPRLPLGRCALIAAYFALAVGVDIRSDARFFIGQQEVEAAVDDHFAYGGFLALGGAILVLLSVAQMRGHDVLRRRSPLALVATTLVGGLVAGFLLPWERFQGQSQTAIDSPAAQLAASVALCIPSAWWRDSPVHPLERVGLAAAAALFTGAAFASTAFPATRAYGAWVALAFAGALLALSLIGQLRLPDITRVSWRRLVMGVAGVLLVAGLFLPLTELCYPGGIFGPTSPDRCEPLSGWVSILGSAAGALAIVMAVTALASLKHGLSRLELAAGIGLLVSALGLQQGESPSGLSYGFWISCGCAAALVVLALAEVGRSQLEWDARLTAVVCCLVYLAVVVPPWWSVWKLPDEIRWAFWFAPLSWLTIAGTLLCLGLIRRWLDRSSATWWLVAIPVSMALLAAVDVVRAEAMTWGAGIVLGLCAVLALLGRVEQTVGVRIAVPEALRIDRL